MIIGFDGNFDKLNPPAPIQSGSGSLAYAWVLHTKKNRNNQRFKVRILGFATKKKHRRSQKERCKNGGKKWAFLKLIRNEDIYETKPNKQHPNS